MKTFRLFLAACISGALILSSCVPPTSVVNVPDQPQFTDTPTSLPPVQPTKTVPSPTLTPQPSPTTPVDIRLPEATLEVEGKIQTAVTGSFCWKDPSDNGSGRVCAAIDHLLSPSKPLLITSDPTGTLRLNYTQKPSSVTLSVMNVGPGVEIASESQTGVRAWMPTLGWAGGMPSKNDQEIRFQPIDPGLAIVQVSVTWEAGNVVYFFLVQTGPAATEGVLPTSETAKTSTPASTVRLQVLQPALQIGKGSVQSYTLSPDGRLLAVDTLTGIYLYHADSFEQAWFYPITGRPFAARTSMMVFNPSGDRLGVALPDGRIWMLDTATGKRLYELQTEAYANIAWSPDGKRLTSGASCHTLIVWNAETGEQIKQILGSECSEGYSGLKVAWSAAGRIYGNLAAWDANTYEPVPGFQPKWEDDSMMSPALLPSPDGKVLAFHDEMGKSVVDLIDGQTGQTLTRLGEDMNGGAIGLAWSGDSRHLAIAYGSGTAILWDAASGKETGRLQGNPSGELFWLAGPETLFGLTDAMGQLTKVDIASGKVLQTLEAHGWGPDYITWTDAGLATSTRAGVSWWNSQDGSLIKQEPGQNPSTSLSEQPPEPELFWPGDGAHSPDGSLVAFGYRVQDAKTMGPVSMLQVSEDDLVRYGLSAWSPDGARLASGDELMMQPVVVWDARSGKVLMTLTLDAGDKMPYLGSLAWSPDGRRLAGSGSLMNRANGISDGMIVLWDTSERSSATGKQIRLLTDAMQQERIQNTTWSPDGKFLAASTLDGNIYVWDMTSFRPVALLPGGFGPSTLRWSPDGRSLASLAGGIIFIWGLKSGS